jgi:PilZ domain-containing protein
MQRRSHIRVRLRLPARLRWSAPLGQRTDECQTINLSRSGVLLACSEQHAPGYPVWVTIPFDAAASSQPETLARVLRCERWKQPEAEAAGWKVAMHFEGKAPSKRSGNGDLRARAQRNGSESLLALPIRVRPFDVPWYEETMTVEVSTEKLKFLTNREYSFGQRLKVAFARDSEPPWKLDGPAAGSSAADDEWDTQVTGIEMQAGQESLCVTVRKKR